MAVKQPHNVLHILWCFLLAAAALYCAGFVAVQIAQNGVQTPFWDEWDHVSIWKKFEEGGISIPSLLSTSAGEHRIAVQVLGSIAPWQLTGMNMHLMMAFNWLLAASFVILAFLITRRGVGSGSIIPWLVLASTSFFIFNPAAYQLWMWGLLPPYLLVPLLLTAVAYVTLLPVSLNVKIVFAAFAALIASLTFGGGLLLWGLVAVPVAMSAGWREVLRRRAAASIYFGLFALALGLYIHLAVTGHSQSPPAGGSGSGIGQVIGFFLAYTGNLVSGFPATDLVAWAQVFGAVILILCGASAFAAARLSFGKPEWHAVVAWCTICLYCLAAAAMVSVARRTFGVSYAVEASRYVLSAAFLPAGVVALAFISLGRLHSDQPTRARSHLLLASAVVAFLSAALVIRAAQLPQTLSAFRHSHFSQLQGKTAIAAANLFAMPQYRNIFPHDDWRDFKMLANFISGQPGFTPPMWGDAFLQTLQTAEPCTNNCGFVDKVSTLNGTLRLEGWAYLANREERAHAVLIAAVGPSSQPRILSVTFPGYLRSDVAKALDNLDALDTGWSAELPAVSAPVESIRCFGYDAESGTVYRLGRARPVS